MVSVVFYDQINDKSGQVIGRGRVVFGLYSINLFTLPTERVEQVNDNDSAEKVNHFSKWDYKIQVLTQLTRPDE